MSKLYYTISEATQMFDGVTCSMLRYWEKEFGLRPHKTEKGSRRYNEKDIQTFRLIYYLVKTKGLTLSGAKRKLKENPETVVRNEEIVRRLKGVGIELMDLVKEFDEMEKTTARLVN
ncbi:MAG: MerR family transcriptional regulator [Dysgonamonadaceae bacterium]|jgi:DNA-binding transcriptional MerR regulator|nr:MerR family transcriptional regulator [Dysgonamonadaceae bacterium]